LARSKATVAILGNNAKVSCNLGEEFTYECFLCNVKNVSVFHFSDECPRGNHKEKLNPEIDLSNTKKRK